MLLRVLCALAPCLLIGASPHHTDPSTLAIKVECYEADGSGVTGSGSWISGHHILTAAHVAAGRFCLIDGKLAPTVYVNDTLDIAVLWSQSEGPGSLPLSCGKPRKGTLYTAAGFPKGGPLEVRVMLGTGERVASPSEFRGLAIFEGAATGGMSGSAIVDRSTGQQVGVLTAGNPWVTFGRTLQDTYLCRK